jgi:hypothetical protein
MFSFYMVVLIAFSLCTLIIPYGYYLICMNFWLIFHFFVKRFYSRKSYKPRGYVRKAVTARAIVSSKRIVSKPTVHHHTADMRQYCTNILDPLFLINGREGQSGKVYIKGFQINITFSRNLKIFLPEQDDNISEELWEIPIKFRVAIVSSKTLELHFADRWLFHPEHVHQDGFNRIKASFNKHLHVIRTFSFQLNFNRQWYTWKTYVKLDRYLSYEIGHSSISDDKRIINADRYFYLIVIPQGPPDLVRITGVQVATTEDNCVIWYGVKEFGNEYDPLGSDYEDSDDSNPHSQVNSNDGDIQMVEDSVSKHVKTKKKLKG